MGTFRVRIEGAGPAHDRYEVVEALVDTGSTFTVLPRSLLRQLGVETQDRSTFKLGDASLVELGLGRVRVRFEGRERYTLVVFGEHALLGAGTLEEFLLASDPVERRLVAVPGLMMRLAA